MVDKVSFISDLCILLHLIFLSRIMTRIAFPFSLKHVGHNGHQGHHPGGDVLHNFHLCSGPRVLCEAHKRNSRFWAQVKASLVLLLFTSVINEFTLLFL